MKVGAVVFAVERGLGYLAKSFYDNGVVNEVAIMHHSSIPNMGDWYPSESIRLRNTNYHHLRIMKDWVASLDVLMFFETPFDWEIIKFCRTVNTKTALMPMYECTPEPIHHPDVYLCPSLLDMEYYPPERCKFIPVPVDEPWHLRKKARVFVHNAGYIGLKGRNGTLEVLKAMQYVKSDLKLIVRSQSPDLHRLVQQTGITKDSRVEIQAHHVAYDDLRIGCDVCLAPEKWNGLSLPLQEARASGMLVMATDRFPFNAWLPTEPLIYVEKYTSQRLVHHEFEESLIDPKDIALKMDEFYGRTIQGYSKEGLRWAQTMSWQVLKPRYMEALSPC